MPGLRHSMRRWRWGPNATQAERAEAARLAAAAATGSWDAAMGAVEASDKAAADAMTGETGGASRIEKDLHEKLVAEGTGALPATTAIGDGADGAWIARLRSTPSCWPRPARSRR